MSAASGIGDLLKFQMMQSFNPATAGNKTNGQTDYKTTVYMLLIQMLSFFFMSIFDQISQQLPNLIAQLKKDYVDKRIENTLNHIKKETLADVAIKLDSKNEHNTVIIIRKWGGTDESSSKKNPESISDESKEIADALLSHIANAENVPTLQLIQSSQFIINYKEKPIEIMKNIYVQIDDFKMNPETLKMQHLVFRITSNIYSTKHIRDMLQDLRKNYIAEQQNQLGNSIWYFEQKMRASRSMGMDTGGDQSDRARMERILNAPPVITYEMRPFQSNKTFENLFGAETRLIRDRVDFFIENPAWYASKGLPYQLGILLGGRPGAGKTALIRAIANRTKRHIINLKLSNLATATQLKNIFFNDYITVAMDDSGHDVKKLLIPPHKRIYVFEEIDTVGELVQERSLQFNANKTVLQDELTLGDILQILDGTIEIPGRIMIMTSNYPERLDRALMRPGRIDVRVIFGFATAETTKEIINGMLEKDVALECLPHEKLTAAEVLNIVFSFIHSKGDYVPELVKNLNDRVKEMDNEQKSLDDLREKMEEEKRLEAKAERKKQQKIQKTRQTQLNAQQVQTQPQMVPPYPNMPPIIQPMQQMEANKSVLLDGLNSETDSDSEDEDANYLPDAPEKLDLLRKYALPETDASSWTEPPQNPPANVNSGSDKGARDFFATNPPMFASPQYKPGDAGKDKQYLAGVSGNISPFLSTESGMPFSNNAGGAPGMPEFWAQDTGLPLGETLTR